MKITKFGHSCILIEEKGVIILIDQGSYSTSQNQVKNIDFVFITHEHFDHYCLENLKEILKNNPQVKIITNKSVGALSQKENISFCEVGDDKNFNSTGVSIEGIGKDHALIYPSIPIIQNTGCLIANKFFYSGDALIDPLKKVEILALPIAAPWMRLSEAIDYALKINPKICFPVHDWNLHSRDRISGEISEEILFK